MTNIFGNIVFILHLLRIVLGVSVLEMVKAFEDASGVKIPMEMAERRPGDVAESYATCDLAEKELGFKCKYTIFDMCKYLDNKPYGGQGILL